MSMPRIDTDLRGVLEATEAMNKAIEAGERSGVVLTAVVVEQLILLGWKPAERDRKVVDNVGTALAVGLIVCVFAIVLMVCAIAFKILLGVLF